MLEVKNLNRAKPTNSDDGYAILPDSKKMFNLVISFIRFTSTSFDLS